MVTKYLSVDLQESVYSNDRRYKQFREPLNCRHACFWWVMCVGLGCCRTWWLCVPGDANVGHESCLGFCGLPCCSSNFATCLSTNQPPLIDPPCPSNQVNDKLSPKKSPTELEAGWPGVTPMVQLVHEMSQPQTLQGLASNVELLLPSFGHAQVSSSVHHVC